jgi:phytol kinase
MFYGIIFVLLTILFWLDTPTGIVALMMMCGGDGFADILGRRYGRSRLPWNKEKSWIGSLGMFIGGWVFSIGIVGIYIWLDVISSGFGSVLMVVTLIAFICTIVESFPIKDLDNITVTTAAVILGYYLF